MTFTEKYGVTGRMVGEVRLPGTLEKFIVQSFFKPGETFCFLNERFYSWCYAPQASTEKPVSSSLLRFGPVPVEVVNGDVRSIQMSAVDLTHIQQLVQMQTVPNNAALMQEGKANIFPILQKVTRLDETSCAYENQLGETDFEHNIPNPKFMFEARRQWYLMRLIRLIWQTRGWSLHADPFENLYLWHSGRMFLRC